MPIATAGGSACNAVSRRPSARVSAWVPVRSGDPAGVHTCWYARALFAGRNGRMKVLSATCHGIRGRSTTRRSDRNSARNRRTASIVGASGVPRLTTRTPVVAGMAARYPMPRARGTKTRGEEKRPGGSLPAAAVEAPASEARAHVGEDRRGVVAVLVLGTERPGLVEVETAAHEQRGGIAAVAEVRVADAALELDGIADAAAQGCVHEVTVVIDVEGTGADLDLGPAEPAHEVEVLGEAIVPADAGDERVEIDAADALGRVFAEREPVLRETDRATQRESVQRRTDAVDVRIDVGQVDEGVAHVFGERRERRGRQHESAKNDFHELHDV